MTARRRKWKAEALGGGASRFCRARRFCSGKGGRWRPPGRPCGSLPAGSGGEHVWIVCARQKVTSDIRARSAFHSSAHAYVTHAPILRSCRFPLRRPWKISFFPPFQPTRVPLSRRIVSFTASLLAFSPYQTQKSDFPECFRCCASAATPSWTLPSWF